MATLGRSAPLPEERALVAEPEFQELVQRSRSLTQKILLAVPDAHRSCIHTETLQLNSSENAKLETMALIINIPRAPVLRAVSENVSLMTCLTKMSEGLQLHRALLSSVSAWLQDTSKVTDLMADIRDLNIQITKMMRMVEREAAAQPTPTLAALHLPGEYEVQLAAHLTLVQLQAFGQDTARCLRSLDQSNEEEAES